MNSSNNKMSSGFFDKIAKATVDAKVVLAELNLVFQCYVDCHDLVAKLMADEATLNDDEIDALLVGIVDNYDISRASPNMVRAFFAVVRKWDIAVAELVSDWPMLRSKLGMVECIQIKVSCH